MTGLVPPPPVPPVGPAPAGSCWCCGFAPAADGPCPRCGALPQGPATAPAALPATRVRRGEGDLGDAFAGSAARTGARLLAFTLDAAVVAAVTGLAAVLTASPLLTAVVALEVVVALTVWQARTGLTVGNAALRLRTTREDRPWSPGAGRGLVRAVVMGAGALGAVVGAWAVVASAAFDPSGRRRTWADRAAGTVVVAVPRRGPADPVPVPVVAPGLTVVAAGPSAAVPELGMPWQASAGPTAAPVPAPAPVARPLPAPGPPPGPVPTAAPAPVPAPTPAPAPVPGPPPVRPPHPPALLAPGGEHLPESTGSPTGPPSGVVPAVVVPAPAPSPVARRAPEPAQVPVALLVLDTGQREQVPLGGAVVLGRAPRPAAPHDRPVVLRDPEGSVSRNHLRVEHSRDGVRIGDLGSANGTAVLGEDGTVRALVPGEPVLLGDGDRVRVGRRVFTVSTVVPEA